METEQEQFEALAEWWKENGRVIIVGLVLGLGSVSGWTVWQNYQHRRAEAASLIYQQLIDSAARDDSVGVLEQADQLITRYPGSGYAPLASLLAARSAYEKKQVGQARKRLQWVIAHASQDALKDIARLRLARVDTEAGDGAAARKALDAIHSQDLHAAVEEVRGDLAAREGKHEAARSAYRAAMADPATSATGRVRLRMKLEDLGPPPASSKG